MNRRAFIGALAAIVAAPAAMLGVTFQRPTPKPEYLTFRGVPLLWDTNASSHRMYYVGIDVWAQLTINGKVVTT